LSKHVPPIFALAIALFVLYVALFHPRSVQQPKRLRPCQANAVQVLVDPCLPADWKYTPEGTLVPAQPQP
jgi:hypothetical protein